MLCMHTVLVNENQNTSTSTNWSIKYYSIQLAASCSTENDKWLTVSQMNQLYLLE